MSELMGKGITIIDGDYESPFSPEKLEAYKKKIRFKDPKKAVMPCR